MNRVGLGEEQVKNTDLVQEFTVQENKKKLSYFHILLAGFQNTDLMLNKFFIQETKEVRVVRGGLVDWLGARGECPRPETFIVSTPGKLLFVK